MCGLFYIAQDEGEELDGMIAQAARRQKAIMGESAVARGEVVPSAVAAALALGKGGDAGVFPMQWGFRLPGKGLIINARSETALDKPLFRDAMLERRCLIPASCYFEWEERDMQQSMLDSQPDLQAPFAPAIKAAPRSRSRRGGNIQKIKYAIRPKTPGIIYLAGVYRYETERKLPVFAILTRAPAPEIAFIHDRMPVIFSKDRAADWLSRGSDPKTVLSLCEREMVFRAV